MLLIGEKIQSVMSEIELPFFIGHGKEDELSACAGSELFHNNIKSSDKTFKVINVAPTISYPLSISRI